MSQPIPGAARRGGKDNGKPSQQTEGCTDAVGIGGAWKRARKPPVLALFWLTWFGPIMEGKTWQRRPHSSALSLLGP